jgi:hypothetical protein
MCFFPDIGSFGEIEELNRQGAKFAKGRGEREREREREKKNSEVERFDKTQTSL